MSEAILAVNVGSSSIKFAIYDAADLAPRLRGQIESIGTRAPSTIPAASAPDR